MSRRLAAAGALWLLLAGCSADAEQDVPLPAVPSACPQEAEPVSVPAECIEGGSDGDGIPVASPSTSPPATSDSIEPVTNAPTSDELARGGNDQDPALTTRVFTVTVPAGGRLRSQLACDGVGTAKLTTVPSSGAEQEFPCSYEGEPVELTVEDATPLPAPQTYEVTVTVEAPARWFVTLSFATGAPPAG